MGVATQVAPIKIGVLIDFVLPAPSHWDVRSDFLDAARITFDDATADGRLDRPIELVIREVEGLPRGTVKAVIDAYGELADEGCLAVFGPMISESAVPLREAIEDRFRIPAISWCGADEWHGEWTFSLSNGSLTDEPYVIANLIAQQSYRRVAVSYERSLIGQKYLSSFRDACRVEGLTITGVEAIAQSGVDATEVVNVLHATAPDAIVHLGFGLGVVGMNAAVASLDWDPPRYMGTSWENGYMNDEIFQAHLGWIGLDQYDEQNLVALGISRPLRGGHRSAAGLLRADIRSRRRADVCHRARRRRTTVAAGRHGGAGAGEDAPGRVWRAGYPHLLREVDAPVGGWVPATSSRGR